MGKVYRAEIAGADVFPQGFAVISNQFSAALSNLFQAFEFPTVPAKARKKESDPHSPIHKHCHPDTQYAEAQVSSQQNAEAHPHGPHGDRGHHHGEGRITGGAKRLGQRECQRPDQNTEKAVHPNDLVGVAFRLF